MSDRIVRVVILGPLGGFGPRLSGIGAVVTRAWMAHPQAQVVAVVDSAREKWPDLSELCPDAEPFELQEDLHASGLKYDHEVCCLPTHLHFQAGAAAIRMGKSVSMEKPLCADAVQSWELTQLSWELDVLLYANMQRRFMLPQVNELVRAGELGFVYHGLGRWLRSGDVPGLAKRSTRGVMSDLGIHMLSTLMPLLGWPYPISVYGTARRPYTGQGETHAEAIYELLSSEGQKVTLRIEVGWRAHTPGGSSGESDDVAISVRGDAGEIRLEGMPTWHTPAEVAQMERRFRPLLHRAGEPDRILDQALALEPCHALQVDETVRCLLGERRPSLRLGHANVLMRMVDGYYRSEESGQIISLR